MSSHSNESPSSASESEDEIEALLGPTVAGIQQRRRMRDLLAEWRVGWQARQASQAESPRAPEDVPPPPPYSPSDQIIRELRLQNEILHETNRQNTRQMLDWYKKELIEVMKTHKKEREQELRVGMILCALLGLCLGFTFQVQILWLLVIVMGFPARLVQMLIDIWTSMFGVGRGQGQFIVDVGIVTHVRYTVTATVRETVYQTQAAVPTGWFCRKLYGR